MMHKAHISRLTHIVREADQVTRLSTKLNSLMYLLTEPVRIQASIDLHCAPSQCTRQRS